MHYIFKNLLPGIDQTNVAIVILVVMMTKGNHTKMNLGARVLVLDFGLISHMVKMHYLLLYQYQHIDSLDYVVLSGKKLE